MCFGVRQSLPLLFGNTYIIPEVNLALFHFNQFAEVCEELVDVTSVKKFGFTPMKIKNEFIAIHSVNCITIIFPVDTIICNILCHMSHQTIHHFHSLKTPKRYVCVEIPFQIPYPQLPPTQ